MSERASVCRPQASISIDEVSIERGEVLTAWVRFETYPTMRQQQVELRIAPDGKSIEVFTTAPENVRLRSFDFWTPLHTKEAGNV